MFQECFYNIIQYEIIKITKLPFFPQICLIYPISKYNIIFKVLKAWNWKDTFTTHDLYWIYKH